MSTSAKHTRTSSKKKGKGLKVTLGIFFGLVAAFAVVFVVDYVLNKDHVPRGSTVAGVDISTLSYNQAADKLEKQLGDIATRPVQVHAGDRHATFTPEAAGLQIDWQRTIEQAGRQSANPVAWVKSFFTKNELDLVSATNTAKFAPESERISQELTVKPTDGRVELVDGSVNAVAPVVGQSVDKRALDEALQANWLAPEGITIQPSVFEPAIKDDAVKEAAEGPAAAAIAAPLTAKGRDGINGVIPPQRMGEVLRFVPDGEKLKAEIDVKKAEEILAEALAATEVKKQNAQVSFASGAKAVTPSQDGVTIEWPKTMEGFAERVTSKDKREFDVAYKDEPATFTTQQAESATFDDVIGEFTTGGFSDASGTNIRQVASVVNGAFVAPGETFSLNGYTGPRGTAQGYVESGIILNGHSDKAVGGGISQFATTLYNAAYFAGMEDVAHTPHSYYISRYPAGREATVFEGAIDLQFKNTSQFPVIIEASADSSQVTVRLKGVKTVNVESINGGRWAQTSPNRMNLSGENCQASGGAPGFTTSETRIIRDLSGREISRETQTTKYDPQPIVTCS